MFFGARGQQSDTLLQTLNPSTPDEAKLRGSGAVGACAEAPGQA